MKQQPAVILLAHGTREPAASEPVHRYAALLSKESNLRVEPCLREFIEPSLPTVVAKLSADGFINIVVVPFFLFNSGHVTRDITSDLAAEKAKHPDLTFTVGKPLGEDPLLGALLLKRMKECLELLDEKRTGPR